MICEAVAIVASHLNAYCERHFQLDDDIVVLSGINDISQPNSSANQNKLIVSLVNVEKDTTYLQRKALNPASQSQIQKNQPLHLNLFIILAANYENDRYQQGLKILSDCIQYLNEFPVFDRENSPEMDNRIEKLMLEIENLTIGELNNVWGVMGRHYLPSILYKARAIGFETDTPKARIQTTSTPDTLVGGR